MNNDIFLILLKKKIVGTRYREAVLTSTHNLCFGAKIRKIGKPMHTPVLLSKSRVQGVCITRTCFPDDKQTARRLNIMPLLMMNINGIFYGV